MSVAFIASPPNALDGLALAVVVMLIYSAARFAQFCFVNLGETSLRIRMLQMVMEAPQGLDISDLLEAGSQPALMGDLKLHTLDIGEVKAPTPGRKESIIEHNIGVHAA